MSADAHPAARWEPLWIATAAALLIAQQVAAKATRDALFLATFEPRALPWVTVPAALLSLLGVVIMSRLLARHGPARVMPIALALQGAAFALEWLLGPLHTEVGAVVLYLHVASTGAVLVSGLWSFVSERVDPHAAKALVARVSAGATLGGVLGGVAVHVIAERLGARATLVVLAASHLVVAAILAWIGQRRAAPSPAVAAAPSGVEHDAEPGETSLSALARSPYLRAIAVVSCLVSVLEVLIDFSFKAAARAEHPDEASLVSFFALFYTAMGVLTFLLQTLLGRVALRRAGVGPTLGALPAFASLGLALTFVLPFPALIVLRAGQGALSSSLFRSAYEVLFLPLPLATKRAAKSLLDVGATRLGDALGSLAMLLALALWPAMPLVAPAVLASVLALAALPLVRRLASGYVDALRDALARGTVQVVDDGTLDLTTQRTLADSTTALDRERVRRAIEAARASQVMSAPDVEPRAQELSQRARFEALSLSDPERARAALAGALDRELVPAALRWLAHPTVAVDASEALSRTAARDAGVLADALVDPEVPAPVRARIPRVLASARTERAAQALALGLDDARLDVRFACARALLRMDRAHVPGAERVHAAVLRELALRGAAWNAGVAPTDPGPRLDAVSPARDAPGLDAPGLDVLARGRATRSLHYVLTLLSLHVDAEAMALALRGLSDPDPRARGTAIELLENVLPSSVRAAMIEVLDAPSAARRDAALAALLRSRDAALA